MPSKPNANLKDKPNPDPDPDPDPKNWIDPLWPKPEHLPPHSSRSSFEPLNEFLLAIAEMMPRSLDPASLVLPAILDSSNPQPQDPDALSGGSSDGMKEFLGQFEHKPDAAPPRFAHLEISG